MDFPIIPAKTGLVCFDTLNIYLHPDDPAAQAAVNQSGILGRLERLGNACRAAGIPLFYPQADHRPDFKDFAPHIVEAWWDVEKGQGPVKSTPPPVKGGTHGAEVIPELNPQPTDYFIKKHRWSAFFQTHLELSLRTAGIDTIILCGGAVEVGVGSTAYAARDWDLNQIIVRDACSGRNQAAADMFMDEVFPYFARVLTVDEVIAQIQQ